MIFSRITEMINILFLYFLTEVALRSRVQLLIYHSPRSIITSSPSILQLCLKKTLFSFQNDRVVCDVRRVVLIRLLSTGAARFNEKKIKMFLAALNSFFQLYSRSCLKLLYLSSSVLCPAQFPRNYMYNGWLHFTIYAQYQHPVSVHQGGVSPLCGEVESKRKEDWGGFIFFVRWMFAVLSTITVILPSWSILPLTPPAKISPKAIIWKHWHWASSRVLQNPALTLSCGVSVALSDLQNGWATVSYKTNWIFYSNIWWSSL